MHIFKDLRDMLLRKVGTETCAVNLSALLKGKALEACEVYSRLSNDNASDYVCLKTALLKRYNLTEEGFRQKLCIAKPESMRVLDNLW